MKHGVDAFEERLERCRVADIYLVEIDAGSHFVEVCGSPCQQVVNYGHVALRNQRTDQRGTDEPRPSGYEESSV
jgi:hypothetical protein